MVTIEALAPDGSAMHASGRTRAEAERRLFHVIEQTTGGRVVRDAGGIFLEYPVVDRFCELPSDHDFDRICFKTSEGRIVCIPRCRCKDPSRCRCGDRGHHSFGEPQVKTNKPRRFADDEIDQLRERLADYVMRCDPDSLRQLAGALPEDFDEGALVPDTDNIPAQGASGDLAANAERRVRRYAEQIFHHVQKFSERNAEVEKVVALWRKSGQDVNEFLPRGA